MDGMSTISARVRNCVNPAHLEAVTAYENWRRVTDAPTSINARKTHCIYGHEFTASNTRVAMHKNGYGKRLPVRKCRACERRKNEERNERRRIYGRAGT